MCYIFANRQQLLSLVLQLAGQENIHNDDERDNDRQAAKIVAAYMEADAGMAAEGVQVSTFVKQS